MTPDQSTELIRSSVWLALQLSVPLLALSFVIGLLISAFQAATQLSDSTVNFVPKLLAVSVSAVALLPWMLQRLSEFTTQLWHSIALPS